MIISDFSPTELATRLKHPGISIHIGPYITKIQSPVASVSEGMHLMYADYQVEESSRFADFHVRLASPRGIRGWFRPQVRFFFDGIMPFKPLPLSQAFPMFEWSLNWCISNHMHQHLVFHAAVLEKSGKAIIMPGTPGAGKSTLCAAMALRGWRLLSDELTLVSPHNLEVTPVPRPVSLKNASIEIIRHFDTSAVLGRVARDTAKGDVAHMRAPAESIRRAQETATPAWIIFPRYKADSATHLEARSKARTLLYAAENSFNYNILGVPGFETAARLVDQCDCYDFTYSNLDEAIAVFNKLVNAW